MNLPEQLEFISSQSEHFTKRCTAELARLRLAQLVRTKSSLWFQSQQRIGATALISKLIDEKLTNDDENFAHDVLAELSLQPTAAPGEIWERLRSCTETRQRALDTAKVHAENRLFRDFANELCTASCTVDWPRLLRYAA